MGLTPHPERYARMGIVLVVVGVLLTATGIVVYTGFQQEFGGLSILFYGILLSFVFTLVLVLPSTFDFLAAHLEEEQSIGEQGGDLVGQQEPGIEDTGGSDGDEREEEDGATSGDASTGESERRVRDGTGETGEENTRDDKKATDETGQEEHEGDRASQDGRDVNDN
ncbi:MAG: hypothetical protein SVU32_01155 [Candidatus Nanohaloarchaea archaeon]|nr:hypothetical protein [Candidatus Nanohaloarchaea archaeon]